MRCGIGKKHLCYWGYYPEEVDMDEIQKSKSLAELNGVSLYPMLKSRDPGFAKGLSSTELDQQILTLIF
jgi:hypothetical protein